eukprot:g10474.t1
MPTNRSWNALNRKIIDCDRCPRLRAHCREIAETKRRAYQDWTYWGRPVANFGDPQARLLIVGLAPAAHGANRTGRMFTGDRSGDWLYRALHRAGFASQPNATDVDDGLVLTDCAITATCHCAPPANKPSREEIAHCAEWFTSTVEIVPVKVFLALGQIGWRSVIDYGREAGWYSGPIPKFGHAATLQFNSGTWLIERAEALYRNVIDEQPANADARHLLGVAAHQRGDHEQAVTSIRKAIAANSQVPLYHSNLGAAYRSWGRLDDAIAAFQSALLLQPDFAEAHYNLALAFEAQGRLDEALVGFQKTIRLAPEFADAYINAGRLLDAAGRHREAIDCFREGLTASPNSAELSYNLGNALQSDGQLDAAVDAYRDAIRSQPLIAEIHNNLGMVLKQLERFDEAKICFDKAIELDPECSDARCNAMAMRQSDSAPEDSIHELREELKRRPESVELRCALASSLHAIGEVDEAVELFETAATAAPDRADVQFALANGYLSQGRHGNAETCFSHGLKFDNGNREAWNALGTILIANDRLEEAADCFENVLRIDPDDAIAAYNLGNVHKDEGRLDEALACYDRAIKSQPDLSAAHINRGVVLKRQGRLDEAIDSQTRAMELGDRDAEAGFHRALAMLHNGDFERGWKEYEWRWKHDAIPRRFPLPVWDGGPLDDRALLVYAEQGVGDEIMFASCLPDVLDKARRSVVECDARLVPLFARSFPLAKVVPRPKSMNDADAVSPAGCDLQIAMGGLPQFTRTRLADFPQRRRYLAADPELVRRWETRLAQLGDNLKIGISWRGGNNPAIRKHRSTTLRQWKTLFAVPNVDWINLQYGECREELENARDELGVTIHDWDDANPIRDLDGFAAQIATLDLVVSIDNSTVHMAGALGVPVWTLLPFAPNWRWLLDRDDSPWYSSMRLFRQAEPENWGPLFVDVAQQLASFVDGARRAPVSQSACPAALEPVDPVTVNTANPDAPTPVSETPISATTVGDTPVADTVETDEDAAERERRKYEMIWTHDDYRTCSPGLDDADKVQLIEHLRSRNIKTILDAGCGSGKLMQRLISNHADEFKVHGFDISRNCLDSFFDDIKDDVLTVGCLWNPDDMPGEFDAVICTDVMEHIPTDRVGAVLANLKSCTRKFAYLAIALFPDGFGPKLIGEPLHLTVKPPNWWFAQISVAGFRIESQAEFITHEADRLARRQLPRTPLLYVLQNDCIRAEGMWMEFGVHRGTTVNIVARYADQPVYGFDSFEGLPEHWREGKQRGRYTTNGHFPDVADNVELIAGWFDETLPEFLESHTDPAAFVHIDCDLYSSAKCVLDLLRDRLVPGSVIVFDELFNYPGYERHEIKAFYEFLNETGIECEWIGIQGPIELVPGPDTEERISTKFSGTAVVVDKIHNNLAAALREVGDTDSAVAHYRQALELDPGYALAHENLGRLLLETGNPEEAAHCFRRALQIAPTMRSAQQHLQAAELKIRERHAQSAPPGGSSASTEPHVVTRTVLHVGCGHPSPASLHQRFRGPEWRELRLDIDPNVKPDIIASLVDMHPVDTNSVDAVWSSHNIEHLYAHEVPVALGEFLRVLKPTGTLLIAMPDLQQVAHFIVADKLDDVAYESPAGPITPLDCVFGFGKAIAAGNTFMAHKTGFTAKSLTRRLIDAGFEIGNCYHTARELRPDVADIHNNLGTLYKQQGAFDDALRCFRKAVDCDPQSPLAMNNLGTLLQFRGEWQQAAECYRRAITVAPNFVGAHLNLGNVLSDLGDITAAAQCYDEVLRLDPESNEARFNRALARIRAGELRLGWQEYESRFRHKVQPRAFPQPTWNGPAHHVRTLLVYAEQGIGDEIMFASCLPDVITRVRQCFVECEHRLAALFARSFIAANVIPRPIESLLAHENILPPIDAQIPMGTLPMWFRTDFAAFPARRHFLVADADAVDKWKQRYAAIGNGMKIGISWRGGNEMHVRRQRSSTLDDWELLWNRSDTQFVNVQYGDCRDEIADARTRHGVVIHDWPDSDPLRDLDDFAAKLSALDMVISVDNSTVHLAGALGVDVWTLLPFNADFRWFTGRDDSPWYPSMRLFRQTETGNWNRAEQPNRERYDHIVENDFKNAARHPLSTFSIDVDTASYTNIRRMLRANRMPPAGAVRIEEMINYFNYSYPEPAADRPFSVTLDSAVCPWNEKHQLVRVGLKGKQIYGSQRTNCNLVFLLDVSGSMGAPNKLPLVKSALRMMVERLSPDDRVAIVVYAGAAGLVLPSTSCEKTDVILDALENLQSGGSTNGGAGIRLAYKVAADNFINGGVNRVILCTDGDFNVGVTGDDGLVRLATEKAKTGVTLSVLGFGAGNLNDSMMQKISKDANGNHYYIDSLREARKVLVEQAEGTLRVIAKDVKIQIDFNPAYVGEYRLIGYENRMLNAEDFKDDSKDAGEIGAGHTVTALYEIIPHGVKGKSVTPDPSRYKKGTATAGEKNGEMLTARLRYKQPDGSKSIEWRVPMKHQPPKSIAAAGDDLRFASAVAAFGLVLRNSKYKGTADYDLVLKNASAGIGRDSGGYRKEFITLVHKASRMNTSASGN